MKKSLLVLNAGSSSLKFTLFSFHKCPEKQLQTVLSGTADGLTVTGDVEPRLTIKQNKQTILRETLTEPTHSAGLARIAQTIASQASEISAIGHRIVHGGRHFTKSRILDPDTMATLSTLHYLAPLHNPHNVTGINAAKEIFPGALQVGVFDTGFHSTLPEHAYTYALPRALSHKYRRYGFHGISHQYVAKQAAKFLNKPKINAISFHLGNGCSACCIREGVSVDTSMGHTPLAGLPMGTRSGDLDPSILIQLATQEGLSPEQISDLLNNKSGLFGLTGSSSSLRVENGFVNNEKDHALAFRIFCYNIRKYLGSYKAVLEDSVDCVIFTGGIGENSRVLRREVCEGLYHVIHDGDHVIPDWSHVVRDGDHVIQDGDHVIRDGDHVIRDKDHVIRDGDHVIRDGDHVIRDEDHVIRDGDHVTDITLGDAKGTRVLVVKTDEERAIADECVRLGGW